MGKVEPISAPAPNNTALWDVLSKTDPAHTKGFNRAGGFKGTAVKPIWIVRRLTEEFGACGVGWGCEKPSFEVVHCEGEILVFCTVSAWHTNKENILFGVGGDKVMAKRQSSYFCDDEAFKKAFTDALGNAFKFVGIAADVHMGLFDDSKYVDAMTKEFSPKDPDQDADQGAPKRVVLDGPYTSKSKLWAAVRAFDREVRGCGDLDELLALLATTDTIALMAQIERDAPQLAHGGDSLPAEFEPLHALIARMRTDLEAASDDSWKRDPLRAG